MTQDAAQPLTAWRRALPVTAQYAYLNHAAVGPLTQAAVTAMSSLAAETSRSGDREWPERNALCERVRALLARMLGAREAHEVAFMPNTSAALSVVAQGLEWRSGDNVVGALCEFPSNVYPWMALATQGVEYRQVPEHGGRLDLEQVLSQVDDRTRVLALSWVQYASGFRADLEYLGRRCREQGILFVVDVIQGLGALQIAVEDEFVDVAAGGSHKWLLGPEGLGFLYVSDRVVHRIRPLLVGWRSMQHLYDWTTLEVRLAPGATRFECGTLNPYGAAALEASLHLLLEVTPRVIEERVLKLADRVAAGLEEAGWAVVSSRAPGEGSGVITATHPRHAAGETCERLAEAGVLVADRAGRLRVSPHFYNTDEEIDRFFAALPG